MGSGNLAYILYVFTFFLFKNIRTSCAFLRLSVMLVMFLKTEQHIYICVGSITTAYGIMRTPCFDQRTVFTYLFLSFLIDSLKHDFKRCEHVQAPKDEYLRWISLYNL